MTLHVCDTETTPHPVDVHVGGRLMHCRLRAGFTQDALAKCVGISFQQVQKYEKGRNRISVSRLWDFARALNAPLLDFFSGLDLATEATPVSPASLKAATLSHAWAAIPDATIQKHLFALINALADHPLAQQKEEKNDDNL